MLTKKRFLSSTRSITPLFKSEFEEIEPGSHPITLDQAILMINGKLASGDFSVECFYMVTLGYHYPEDVIKEVVEAYKTTGWHVSARRIYADRPEELRDWQLSFS